MYSLYVPETNHVPRGYTVAPIIIIIIIIIMFGVTSSRWSPKSRNSQHANAKVRVPQTAFAYSSIAL